MCVCVCVYVCVCVCVCVRARTAVDEALRAHRLRSLRTGAVLERDLEQVRHSFR